MIGPKAILAACSACVFLGALPGLADPAPAVLVEDINTTADDRKFDVWTSPIVDVGGVAYFVAQTRETGYELWRSDGTVAGTALVKDILVGAQPAFPYSYSPPESLTNVNGTLFFVADDGVHGRELWKSDGTAAGTGMVKDIRPGALESFSPQYPESDNLTNVNGTLFFVADDGVHGLELWKSDGTEAGTVLVKDVWPGALGSSSPSYPSRLVNVNGTLFFSACSDNSLCFGLWKSDGTSAGTVLVKDFGVYFPLLFELTDVNGRLFFWITPEGGATGSAELWTSDGTSAGTISLGLIGGVNYEEPGATPFDLTNVGGTLFFRGSGAELWKSDGTVAGTVMVKDIWPGAAGSLPNALLNVNGALYFYASDGSSGYELWKSDGTEAGTVLVKDIFPGSGGSIVPIFYSFVRFSFAHVNGTLFFAADDGTNGEALWKSDGTEAGTVLVKDVMPGPYGDAVKYLTSVGGALLFTGRESNAASVYDLWKSDGTPAGTVKVEAGPAGATAGAVPSAGVGLTSGTPGRGFASVNGNLFFQATDAASGAELWKSDGTAAGGTERVEDIAPGSSSGSPFWLTNVNGTLFFRATDAASGTELWKSDGTAAGTGMVEDIDPGAASSDPLELTDVNGTLFFAARDAASGLELWKSDGTEAGTVRVKDIWPGTSSSDPRYLVNVNGTLFFAAADGVTGRELWKSDGTEAGTVLVKDIVPGASGTNPRSLVNANGTLFFLTGSSLWKSDGTAAGTVSVASVGSPQTLTHVNGTLFFSATASGGSELWKSDGTSAGTLRVKDIHPTSGSDPAQLTNANGTLFFTADDGTNGRELWKSDGTELGTTLVEDTFPGLPSGSLGYVVAVRSRVVFQGNDGASGEELWTSDGTPAGTHRVADVGPVGGSLAEPLAEIGALLLFSAQAEATGRELYSVPTAALADGDQDGLDDADEVALGTDPDDADSDDDGLADGAEVNTHGTLPLDSDTDDDGWSDGAEVLAGTDPLDPQDFPPGVPLAGAWGLAALAGLLLASAYGATRRARARSA